MAWFRKHKASEHVAPALCARCRERLGTVLVRFVAGPEPTPLEPDARAAWLCDACHDEVRREAPDN